MKQDEKEIIEQEIVEEQHPENLSNEEIEKLEEVVLNITLEGTELNILLSSLTEYISFLRENQKRTNSIVIDSGFNQKIEERIKKADELRYLIKKGILIVDKDKPVYSMQDEGEIVGIETFITTEKGSIVQEASPQTVGSTPAVKPRKVVPGETVVQSVSEEL